MKQKTGILWALLGVCLVGLAWSQGANDGSYIKATPETESAFLKTYTPGKPLQSFTENHQAPVLKDSEQVSGGNKFASHQKSFAATFEIKSKDWMALMAALREDVVSQLYGQGAQVLEQTGDARDGFQFTYKIGKAFGDMSVDPLKIISTGAAACPPEIACGKIAVEAHIVIRENWFRVEPGTVEMRVGGLSRP